MRTPKVPLIFWEGNHHGARPFWWIPSHQPESRDKQVVAILSAIYALLLIHRWHHIASMIRLLHPIRQMCFMLTYLFLSADIPIASLQLPNSPSVRKKVSRSPNISLHKATAAAQFLESWRLSWHAGGIGMHGPIPWAGSSLSGMQADPTWHDIRMLMCILCIFLMEDLIQSWCVANFPPLAIPPSIPASWSNTIHLPILVQQ